MDRLLILAPYSQAIYKKCGLCSRVKDCLYRLDVHSAQSFSMLVGSLDLCKICSENMGEIIKRS
ncbi:hypothetical protein CBF85_07955 [Lactobacillus taiwanensis]|nr:hypothetical protein CBF51_06050 [Lactobacillus taiwanensis]OYS01343.1 hypothetical protein CBF61_05560 [Lactobacillus taiwanensis]OYS14032.1 hypothetical protein CBF69_08060 [Lactobacillus taiwanensis]OYS19581.1 hypothetical protein CBF49_03850 [Lactobacillus taiwanensis]OYS20607.1 hypothetical protein CBF56_00775 [Lactobacillus taiwanensis]